MLDHECIDCAKANKLMEEKEKKINVYQNNLFELKSKMTETSSLINVYFNYKNENEILKKEMESLKKKADIGSVASVNNSKINYEIELIRNKFLKECDRTKALEVANSQLNAMVEEFRANKDSNLRNEINKLKKEISDRERKINSLNSLVDKLNSELNTERVKKLDVNRIDDRIKIDTSNIHLADNPNMFDINHNEDILEVSHIDKNQSQLIDADFNLILNKNDHPNYNINLSKENEHLKQKFHKYQMKYIKFKYKYKTLKSLTKYIAQSERIPKKDNFLKQKKKRADSLFKEGEVSHKNNFSNRKSTLSCKNSLNRSIELFDNTNNYIFETFEPHHENKEIVADKEEESESSSSQSEEESKEDIVKKKNKSKAKTKSKSKDQPKTKKEKKSNKIITTPKKPRKKIKISPVEESSDKDSDMDIEQDIKPEIESEPNATTNIPPITNRIINHIGPIRKEKVDESLFFKKQKEEFCNNFINFINSINFEDDESVNNYIKEFCIGITLHEKITKIIETIIEFSEKIELLNILYFLKLFVIFHMNTNVIHIFNEFMLAHLELIQSKRDIKFQCSSKENISIKIFNNNSVELSKINDYLNTHYIISYLISIFYTNLPSQTEVFVFIFELIERLNDNNKMILTLFRKLTKSFNINTNLNSDKEIENLNKNCNKIYFLNNYKKSIITETMSSFILTIIDFWSDEKEDNEYINNLLNILNNKLNELEGGIKVSEVNNDKINFTIDMRYLEIYQMIFLFFKIKDCHWIYTNVFENLLWISFLNTEEESLKRIGIIFYVSYLVLNFISRDVKCENENTQKLINWIYAIFDPKYNSQRITPYDRIAALSGFIDTHIVKYDASAYEMVKLSVQSILKSMSKEIMPEDFVEKLKKLNIIS